MSDAPFMISPAGFIVDYNFSAPGTGIVTQLLPGATVQLRGGGEFDLTGQLGGARGSLQVDLVTGAAGSAQGLAFLVGNLNPTSTYLGISLDTSNRPTFTITDVQGATKAHGSPSGSALAAGVVLSIVVAWDASGSASFTVGGVAQPVVVVGPWTAFSPVAVLYGAAGAAAVPGMSAFVGKFNKVQTGNVSGLNQAVASFFGPVAENVRLAGASAMTATAKVAGKAQAALHGAASISATHS